MESSAAGPIATSAPQPTNRECSEQIVRLVASGKLTPPETHAVERANDALARHPGRVYAGDTAPCGDCPAFSSRLIGPDGRDIMRVRWIDPERQTFGVEGSVTPRSLAGHYAVTAQRHVWADFRVPRTT